MSRVGAREEAKEGTGSAGGISYARLDNSVRLASDKPVSIALRHWLQVYPYPRRFLRPAMDAAYRTAEMHGGFHLGGFVVRRVLGKRLVIHVDPTRLEHFLDERALIDGRPEQFADCFIGGGDWSPLISPLWNTGAHREMVELAGIPDRDFTKSRAYRYAYRQLGEGQPIKRNFVTLDTPEKIDGYFLYLIRLIESVEKDGLMSRGSFGSSIGLILSSGGIRRLWLEFFESDVGVAIDADGTLLRFASGKHRTGAAVGLGLNSIPVEVRMVHCDWLNGVMRETRLGVMDALLEGIDRLNLGNALESEVRL